MQLLSNGISDTQQVYALLMQIDKLLAEIELKIKRIEGETPKLERNLNTLRQLERVAIRYTALARRISGSEKADDLLRILSRILIVMRMLEISGSMIAMGVMTGGLGGAISVVGGIAGLAMTQTSMLEGY